MIKFQKFDSKTGIYHFKLIDGTYLKLVTESAIDCLDEVRKKHIKALEVELKEARANVERLKNTVHTLNCDAEFDCHTMYVVDMDVFDKPPEE